MGSAGALQGDVDVARLLRTIPADHTIKGVFIAPNASAVARDWPELAGYLRAPPRGGKYIPFTDYPLSDHVLIADAAARRMFPGHPTRQAHRLLGRSTIEEFTKTTLGRVALALVSNPKTVFTKYCELFNKMLSGPSVGVTAVDATSAELEYRAYYYMVEAIHGVLEGLVALCGSAPVVTVSGRGDGRYVARAEWQLE
jgi:uncharacterized protein (TIGR02265 family)